MASETKTRKAPRWAPMVALVTSTIFAVGCDGGCDIWHHEEPLRLGLLVFPSYELAHLAKVRGYYDADRVRVVDYRSPAEMMRAYRYGLLDVMAVTTDYFIQLRATDDSHRIIMVVDISQGGDTLVAQPHIREGPALAGRRVGFEASALGAHVLLRCLSMHGLALSDVEPIPVDIPDHARAFLDERVDAVVTYEPTRTRLLAAGARELCTSRDLGDDIVDVLITRVSTVEERRGDLRHLVDGWLRAGEHFRTHPDEAAEPMARREGITPEALLHALEGIRLADRDLNEHMLLGRPPRIEATLVQIRDRFVEYGLLRSPFPLENAVDPRVLEGSP